MADDEQKEGRIEAVAQVIGHLIEDLNNDEARDILADCMGKEEQFLFLAAWARAQIRRDLAKRGLLLPDYSLRGVK